MNIYICPNCKYKTYKAEEKEIDAAKVIKEIIFLLSELEKRLKSVE